MALGFGSHTCCAGLDILFDKFPESGPCIITTDEVDGLVLSGGSGKDVVMLMMENSESEVIRVRNVDEIILTEESIGTNGPTGLRLF